MAIFIKDENYKEMSKIFIKDLNSYKQICKVYICTGPNQYELLFDNCVENECTSPCDCDTFCSQYCDNPENGDLGCSCNIHRIPEIAEALPGYQRICCCGQHNPLDKENPCDCDLPENNYILGTFESGRCYVNDICFNRENYEKGPTIIGNCWTPCCGYPDHCDIYYNDKLFEHNEPCCYKQVNSKETIILNSDLECKDGEELEGCDLSCKIRWLSIYDDLLLNTDGPTPEGITKIICPEETCNSGNGLKTTCLDDDICCDCEVEVPIPLNYEKCEPLIDLSCPCLQLDQVHCTNLPSYLNNTCKVYAWTALGGVLQEDGTCDSCSRPERTETAQCCINGRRYTYIKKVVWNNNPIDSSNCGIKKTCSLALFDNLISSEGGVAKDGPIIYNCPGAPSNTGCEVCEPACCGDEGCGIQGCDTLEDWCRNWACNPAHRERCEVYNLEVRQKSVCEICQGFMTEDDDPCDCLPDPPCPQTPDNPECVDCASCTNDPCNFICATYCDNIDICAEICGPPPDFLCAFGVVGSNYLDLMEQCGCAPPSNACDDICFS